MRVIFGRKRTTALENEIFRQRVGNIGQQVALTRIDCYRVTVMAGQNFLTVRPLSLNPDDHRIRAVSIFDMFYSQKAEISADSTRSRE